MNSDSDKNEMLAFRLGSEEYGIHIMAVQELRGYEHVTRIANAPACVKGMLNLRGVIVPIIDLRIKFGLAAPVYDATTVVIVLNIGDTTVGMVVDSVTDVIDLPGEQIRPAPDMGMAVSGNCLTGIGLLGERMLILVDIERLVSLADLDLTEALAA
ncbi:chemotaxis protein CheW [Massilia yuzhufengensis]|uniref:Chemotaxis protein CheW n=1 Tax=Massilia yuzhufengensis TaxID=1164594 RepID=A0A1I1PXF6_9BURK|nr:chemotaxis protein CheW [Massilia yuzhufengensis]SFD14591.1 purine-binding chemotaxis protein CheW [Massilia yuzhufengensis]